GDHSAQWPHPLTQVSEPLRLARLLPGVVDRHGDQRLDRTIVVYPRPDLPLMLIAGRPAIEVGVAAEQPAPGLELVLRHGAHLPPGDGHTTPSSDSVQRTYRPRDTAFARVYRCDMERDEYAAGTPSWVDIG